MNPLKAEGFPWLAAKQEVRTSKHERDSTHRCWLEEGKSRGICAAQVDVSSYEFSSLICQPECSLSCYGQIRC